MSLTVKQSELLEYLRHCESLGDVAPSFDQMKSYLGLKSKSGVHRLILALEERGYILRRPNRARAIEVVDKSEYDRGFLDGYREATAALKAGLAAPANRHYVPGASFPR